jgi:hypothetical protein
VSLESGKPQLPAPDLVEPSLKITVESLHGLYRPVQLTSAQIGVYYSLIDVVAAKNRCATDERLVRAWELIKPFCSSEPKNTRLQVLTFLPAIKPPRTTAEHHAHHTARM